MAYRCQQSRKRRRCGASLRRRGCGLKLLSSVATSKNAAVVLMAGACLVPCLINARRMAYNCQPFAFAPLARGRMALPRGFPPRLSLRNSFRGAHAQSACVPPSGWRSQERATWGNRGRSPRSDSERKGDEMKDLAAFGSLVLTVARTQSVSWCFARSLCR